MAIDHLAVMVKGQDTSRTPGFWLSVYVVSGYLQREDTLNRIWIAQPQEREVDESLGSKLKVIEPQDIGVCVIKSILGMGEERNHLSLGEKGSILLEGDLQCLSQLDLKTLLFAHSSFQFENR